MRIRQRLVVGLLLLPLLLTSASVAGEGEFQSTHKQVRIVKPMHDGKPITLNTFCLDKNGNLLTCVGGDSYQYATNADGTVEATATTTPGYLQVYSPEGELIRETELPFAPTAVNQSANGEIFVAGHGKLAKLNAEGKVISTADSPHIGDLTTFKQRVEETAKKQIEEFTASYREQITRIDERIAKLKEKPEAELTEKDRKRMETYEQQKSLYEEQLKSQEEMYSQVFSGEQMLTQKLGITAVAVTSQYVFLCCNSVGGHGYEVWRTNHEFSDAKQVVTELGGCCGQCDIQATEKHLVLAENTRFKVGLLDHDGQRVFDFGKGDRKSVDGFGSCCNPMNVRCCDNGDILTAESSIGTIKRFNDKGELVGVIGKARIGGGCKHVALGHDEQRNRYYMMNVDKSHICVLLPNAEAPETTPEELLAKAAREGLGRKLVGEWSLNGQSPSAGGTTQAQPESGIAALIGGLLGSSSSTEETVTIQPVDDPYGMGYLKFHDDGKLTLSAGMFADGDNGWEAVSQDGNTIVVSMLQEEIQYYDLRIEFVTDDEINVSMMFNENVMSSQRLKRVKAAEVTPAAEAEAPASTENATEKSGETR